MQTIKKAAQAVSQSLPDKPASISLPKSNGNSFTAAPRTPRTPADEAIAFFSGSEASADGALLQVWELSLEDDGGPSYEKSVGCPLSKTVNADSLPCSSVYTSTSSRPTVHSQDIPFARIRGYEEWCLEDRLSPRRRSIRASGLEGKEAANRR